MCDGDGPEPDERVEGGIRGGGGGGAEASAKRRFETRGRQNSELCRGRSERAVGGTSFGGKAVWLRIDRRLFGDGWA